LLSIHKNNSFLKNTILEKKKIAVRYGELSQIKMLELNFKKRLFELSTLYLGFKGI